MLPSKEITTKELQDLLKELLNVYPEKEQESIIWLILEQLLGLKRLDLLQNTKVKLEAAQRFELEEIMERLNHHEPIQYILGNAHFFGLTFQVNPNVLIPRQETEELVKLVITEAPKGTIRILDVGTGSGCIAVSLAKNLEAAQVEALDISQAALYVAKENAKRNGVNVSFIQGDILAETKPVNPETYDIIVSNPPYVMQSEMASMQLNVLDFEPKLALFVPDSEALLYYRHIGNMAYQSLKPGGCLYVEINEQLGYETLQILMGYGFKEGSILQDIHKKDRIIRCRKG